MPDGHAPSLRLPVLAVFFLLSVTTDERLAGTIADEQEMLSTAVALAESGDVGVARGQFFMVSRPGGDAVSPYGMGLPLLEVAFVPAAERWERLFGARTSQTLFAFLQIALVTVAAAGAGLLARELGADAAGQLLALFATAIASPLWACTGTDTSEPLQAAALVLAVLFAARAARRGGLRLAAAAGFCAGYAVLTKGSNLLVVPFLALPVLLDGDTEPRQRTRLAGAWGAGALAPLAAWLAFEIARFGRPFTSYEGQRFTHPFFDGLWRLLVGVNKGLIWYFPLILLSALGVARLLARRGARGSALSIAGAFGTLLALASAWWAWDGTFGWGPRLLVPAIPLLAAAASSASAAASGGFRLVGMALAIAGAAVNLLGVLVPDAAAAAYVSSVGPIAVRGDEAARYPGYFLGRRPDGSFLVPRDFVAPLDPAFSPLRVHAFLLRARLGVSSREQLSRRLAAPPWLGAHPGAVPHLAAPAGTVKSIVLDALTAPFFWPHLFAAGLANGEARERSFVGAYDGALADQVYRRLDLGDAARAGALAARLWRIAPSGPHAALVAESLRAGGKPAELRGFLGSLPDSVAGAPNVLIVRALAARDEGDETGSRRILEEAHRARPRAALRRALARPAAEWPRGLHPFLNESLGPEGTP